MKKKLGLGKFSQQCSKPSEIESDVTYETLKEAFGQK